MFAIGSVRTLLIESIEENKIELDMNGFLTNVVLADLNMSGKVQDQESIKFRILSKCSRKNKEEDSTKGTDNINVRVCVFFFFLNFSATASSRIYRAWKS